MAWSSAAECWGRVVLALQDWLQKSWKWLAVACALLAVYFLGRTQGNKTGTAVSPERDKIKTNADSAVEDAAREAEKRVQAIAQEAEDERNSLQIEIVHDLPAEDDSEGVNEYLLDVGEEMRK
jgi:hypothetical protein